MAPGASAADSSGGDADALPCLCFIISATSMKDAKAQTHDGNGNLVSRTLRHDCHAKPAEGIWNEWTKVFIGEGGFGTVHCLRGVYSSKKLVFKTSERSHDKEFMLAGLCASPNVLAVYLTLPQYPLYHIIFEEARYSFQDWIISGDCDSVPDSEVCNSAIISQLIDAVSFIHGKGVLHRDIKPANMLIKKFDQRGRLSMKLGDFGSATLQGDINIISGSLPWAGPRFVFDRLNIWLGSETSFGLHASSAALHLEVEAWLELMDPCGQDTRAVVAVMYYGITRQEIDCVQLRCYESRLDVGDTSWHLSE